MAKWLMTPPVAFAIMLVVAWVCYRLSNHLAIKPAKDIPGKHKLYACGEDLPIRRVQPDYSQFFPFAFFFTIMHVVALVLATVPSGSVADHGLALIYVGGAAVGLVVLFRGQS
jgi:hypothetical protein